jgi:hypothetical protein
MNGDLFADRFVNANNLIKGGENINDDQGLDNEISTSNIHHPGDNQVNGDVRPWPFSEEELCHWPAPGSL